MSQAELVPISSLETEVLVAKEEALSKYSGPDRIVDSDAMRKMFASEQKKSYSFSTGMARVDAAMGNLETGELIAIGGPTKHGKTTLAQTWTVNLAASGVNCLWFSFEVPARQFLNQIRKESVFYLPKLLKVSDKNWLRDRIIEAKLKNNARVVFIDNLHHLIDMQNVKNMSSDIGVVIRDLKRMAVELNIVVIILCHSKKGENVNGVPREVSEWDLRDSSFIPQESDSTVMVQRKMLPSGEFSSQALVKVCLHRRTGSMNKKIHVIKTSDVLEEDEAYYLEIPGKC